MSVFVRLLVRLKHYRVYVILSIFFNILLSVFTVISIPLLIPFFQILFDRSPQINQESQFSEGIIDFFQNLIFNQGKGQALIIICGLIILAFLLKNICRYLAIYSMAPVRTGILRDVRNQLFESYMHLSLNDIHSLKTGDLISRITNDVQELEISILKVIQVIFKEPLIILGSILVMLYISPALTLFVLLLLVFTIFVIGTISRTLKRKSNIAQSILGRLTSMTEEGIGGLKVVKAFDAEPFLINTFKAHNEKHRNTLLSIIRKQELSSPLSEFLAICVVTALMYYGANMVFKESLLPETFFAFIFAFYQVIEPSKSFSTAYYNIQKGLASAERIDQMIELGKHNVKRGNKAIIQFKESIQINRVSFRYPDTEKDVLNGIQLSIGKGEVIALVGPSGSGKTTLTDLILGFYPNYKGDILIDEFNQLQVDPSSWRRQFGLVSQHPVLFNDSVKNNITFGLENVADEQIIQACQAANAHEFIQQLPNSYDTLIGEKGMKLSGGQRQRLTIARAILQNPPILILDEATSSLDSESEHLVQEAIANGMKGRTVILVAHRFSSIKNADRIYLFDRGKIIGMGSHQDLYSNYPLYKKLVDHQDTGRT